MLLPVSVHQSGTTFLSSSSLPNSKSSQIPQDLAVPTVKFNSLDPSPYCPLLWFFPLVSSTDFQLSRFCPLVQDSAPAEQWLLSSHRWDERELVHCNEQKTRVSSLLYMSTWVLYCCVTNYHTSRGLKQHTVWSLAWLGWVLCSVLLLIRQSSRWQPGGIVMGKGSSREELISSIIQVVGRTHFLLVVWLRSLFSCWL